MRKLYFLFVITAFFLTSCTSQKFTPMCESPEISAKQSNNYINGVWVSYLEFDEYLCNKSKSEFENVFSSMIDNCKNMGINSVFVQVRSHADACYKSEIFPTSKHLSGELGRNVNYDALQIMTQICRQKGIAFHAWVNPYRAYTEDEIKKLPVENQIVKWYNKNQNLVLVDGRYYLNPASDEVINFVNNGIKEILRYDIDGIHFDDYFYPTTDKAVDEDEFSKSKYDNLQKFRLDRVSELISTVYKTVKEYNKYILFGVSPQGNIENDYSTQYADVKKWCSQDGYIDYIAPQIYYGFENEVSPFSQTLSNWNNLITNKNVKLLVGLAGYKVGNESGEWTVTDKIMYRQISECRSTENCKGIIFYRYNSLFGNINKKMQEEIDAFKPIIK